MARLLDILWRKGQARGIGPCLLCSIAWLVGGAAIAWAVAAQAGQHPILAFAFLIAVTMVVAAGGLVCFWILADHIDFRSCGYRVRSLTASEWVYDERRATGAIEFLPFSRVLTGDGYPAPCEIHLPNEQNWDQQTPHWAHGRRNEILKRIADRSGKPGHVHFKHSP